MDRHCREHSDADGEQHGGQRRDADNQSKGKRESDDGGAGEQGTCDARW
jgi:hypothetical protein